MSGYSKPSGVRFKILGLIKKQITLESASVNMLKNERKAVKKIIIEKG